MATKVTSLASSSSGAPTPPNPTPCTSATDDVDSLPTMDLAAVGHILEPIQEVLNEAAEESKYPSPPTNTPEIFTPAHSVRSFNYGRGRGLSLIGDRLSQLKIEARSASSKDKSVSERDDDDNISNGKDKFDVTDSQRDETLMISIDSGEILIGLGSPKLNPLIQEYHGFQSGDSPATSTAAAASEVTAADRPSSAGASTESEVVSSKSAKTARFSMQSEGGVTEKTNWAEEVVDDLERALSRLEQLAQDEHFDDPSKEAEEYYEARLKELLASDNRKYPVKVNKKDVKVEANQDASEEETGKKD
ncbi:hypothetical protein K505DRAFT_228445 [Melanomma pulvis-pyrius CBS 109.77]|uniref:Uncharacterized protein n=1 Tax=Melanomma pulvis-pyrius CBS 109.77 TaxID=1314802 RepID=A0A6A6XVQ6_9PLEO|nr:hypothetical protein K505DRAFT_228445 [Melanomma pulvis-pyrius CBS 109.77]